jgi:hypothetical protein
MKAARRSVGPARVATSLRSQDVGAEARALPRLRALVWMIFSTAPDFTAALERIAEVVSILNR